MRYVDARDAVPATSRVLHTLAPLDTAVALGDLWPLPARRAGLVRSATVYDLIPESDPDTYLVDPAERSRYRVRLELLRSACQLHVLSRAVASDLTRLLGVVPDRIVLAGAAPPATFSPPADRGSARLRARSVVHGLTTPYVMYPTGHHPRKNNEALVAAWSLLPRQVTQGYRLLLVGALPPATAHHLEHLAASLGIPGSVVVAGYVDDDALLRLYQGAELLCFPSLAEGYGLPVAEALACGVPVIASDRPPLDELVSRERRFDPESPRSIAETLLAALHPQGDQDGHGGRVGQGERVGQGRDPLATRAMSVLVPTWRDVATRTAAAFDELLGSLGAHTATRPPTRRSHDGRERARVAFVSPLPPAPTGVASYSYRLLEAVRDLGSVSVDAFADGPAPQQRSPRGIELFHARALETVEQVRGGYDAVVYALGNSHHHLGALAALRRRRGVVVAHDVRMTNLYVHEHGDPGLLPGGLQRAIRAMYGDKMPDEVGHDGSVSPADLARYGLLMAREVVASSDLFLVSSHAAADLAAIDAGTALAERVDVLPFALAAPRGGPGDAFVGARTPPPPSLPEPFASRWAAGPEVSGGRTVVAHLGIVDPAKEPDLLLEAFARARLPRPDLLLAYVGPVSDELALFLARRSAELEVEHHVVVTGGLDAVGYRAWLACTTVAVQLRRASNGEASATIGECLACGVATITTDRGWARELPDDVVVRVPPGVDAMQLAGEIAALAGDEQRRAALGSAGRAYAERNGFARTAAALIDALAGARGTYVPASRRAALALGASRSSRTG
ncbi:MAG: glycosyltransferase [Acidimicrobiales bacterium]